MGARDPRAPIGPSGTALCGSPKTRRVAGIVLGPSLAQSSQRLDQLLAVGGPSPSDAVVAGEQRLRLAEVLERLPEDYRQVILLRNLQDLPYEEIARRMDRGVGAVRMLWVRALARLRDEIRDESEWRQ